MDKRLSICIWDLDNERLENIDRKVRKSLSKLGVSACLTSNSEPPLVARMNLTGRVPALEINDTFWSQVPGSEFSQEACDQLIALAVKNCDPKTEE